MGTWLLARARVWLSISPNTVALERITQQRNVLPQITHRFLRSSVLRLIATLLTIRAAPLPASVDPTILLRSVLEIALRGAATLPLGTQVIWSR